MFELVHDGVVVGVLPVVVEGAYEGLGFPTDWPGSPPPQKITAQELGRPADWPGSPPLPKITVQELGVIPTLPGSPLPKLMAMQDMATSLEMVVYDPTMPGPPPQK